MQMTHCEALSNSSCIFPLQSYLEIWCSIVQLKVNEYWNIQVKVWDRVQTAEVLLRCSVTQLRNKYIIIIYRWITCKQGTFSINPLFSSLSRGFTSHRLYLQIQVLALLWGIFVNAISLRTVSELSGIQPGCTNPKITNFICVMIFIFFLG